MLTNLRNVFDSKFGDNWILTGSAAIHQYLNYFGLDTNFVINDIDIIYVHNDLFYNNNFNGFKRLQSSPQRSMTFVNDLENVQFDVNTQPKERYFLINQLRVVDPHVMLDDYLDNFSIRGRRATDQIKISALEQIINRLKDPNINKPTSNIISTTKNGRRR